MRILFLGDVVGNSGCSKIMNNLLSQIELKKIDFVHRTFNKFDLIYFLKSLKNIYENHDGLENVFSKNLNDDIPIFFFRNPSLIESHFFILPSPSVESE